jgi:hypothetical protein
MTVEVCRKCGYAGSPNTHYVKVRPYQTQLMSNGWPLPVGEHLVLRCNCCDYERLEPVKEAD